MATFNRFLKHGILSLACICITATAQISRPTSFGNRSAADLLREYQTSGAGTLHGQSLLIGMLNKHLSSTSDNIKSIRTHLATTRDPDEKILLLRVLASMYTPRSRSSANLSIENDIRASIGSPDTRVARYATIEYSRLAYPPDRYQVLRRAHESKVIDDDTYFGELAHGLRFSPEGQQAEMMTELERAHNSSANEILASTFGVDTMLNQLPHSTKVRLLNELSVAEPNFPLELDSFGMIDVVRYTFWLNSIALLDATLNGHRYSDVVIGQLSTTKDPRKIAAFFASPEGKRVIGESSARGKLLPLLARVQAYSDSLPGNAMLRSATQTFAGRLYEPSTK